VNIGLAVAMLGLTSLAVAMLLVPLLLRRGGGASRDAYNLAVYRDQMAELDRDIGRGVLTAEQAEAARAEIGRRILALNPDNTEKPSNTAVLATASVAILLLPVTAWLIYWQLGSPALPDQPFAENHSAATPAPQVAGNGNGAPHIDMNDAVTKLTAHLKEQPNDLTGWLLLARSQLSLNHFQEAADAYRRAADLSGQRADIVGDWGEAQVLAAGGSVTPGARQAFETALKDPESAPRSRYYLGLAQLQQGDTKGAMKAWTSLEADSPTDAEWLPLLQQRIKQAAATLGVAPPPMKTVAAAAPPSPPTPASAAAPPPPTSPPSANSGPSEATVAATAKATANASPQDRQAMILGMVAKLSARLESQPDDLDGWTRLGRSYLVLNQPQQAAAAYAHAVKLKPDDMRLKEQYAEAVIQAAGDAADVPSAATSTLRDVLQAEPQNQMALWYVGIAEAAAGHSDAARDLWSRLLAQLPAGAPERHEVEDRLAALKQGGAK
jgi:cytochrome c-type biogenesis protein CcmH